ncbi:MAG: pseudouridine synthase [Gammaproteobacteria bacterium]
MTARWFPTYFRPCPSDFQNVPNLVLFNKPFGVVSQFNDLDGHPGLAHHLDLPGFRPAGRLDHDSEGLLLLTDDGALQHRITAPTHKMSKAYWAQVEGTPDEKALEALRTGVQLNDGITLPAKARFLEHPHILWPRNPPVRFRKSVPDHWIELVLTEGRNRQVRRMTAAVGLPTLRLIRYRVGSWTIDGLPPGAHRMTEVGR